VNRPSHEPSAASLRWLSRDYAELRAARDRPPYDVLIVGSGYGGAMAAAELAGRQVVENGVPRPVRICVLERGNEYAPGMFASSLQELPPHVRVHRGGHAKTLGPLDALLDVRMGPDVCTLTGNGLGGGSLINAGVMEKPRLADVKRLPQVLRQALTDDFFEEVKTQLGATQRLSEVHPRLPKGEALRQLLEDAQHNDRVQANASRKEPLLQEVKFRHASITVQVARDDADTDVPPCTLCGDCMTGCNVGAKKSLDTTLLREAWRKGAEIYTGASVVKVRKSGKPNGGWSVSTVYTDESLRRRHWPLDIKARHVILAAGSLGSTEILLRSRTPDFQLSEKLGEQFSCNGDNLVALHDGPEPTGTTADEFVRLRDRRVGPTITSVIQMEKMLLQEFAVPAPLKRLFDESVTTSRLLHSLAKEPSRSTEGCDSFGVDHDKMERTLLVGLIGHDESSGRVLLDDPARPDDGMQAEGRVRIEWPALRASHEMEGGFKAAKELVAAARGKEAPFLPNPLWRLLPDEMDFLVKGERGPVLTVHPLGGCPIGESHLEGVVDDCGRVFDPLETRIGAAPAIHEGLVVLDGSIVPASLGANPALTIAALAKRAAGLLALEWDLQPAQVQARVLRPRPVFRPPESCTPPRPTPTEVELTERLIGPAGSHLVELTLAYQPASVASLMSGARPKLQVDEQRSFIRVYPGDTATRRKLKTSSEPQRDDAALFVARVAGSLDMLRQDLDTDARKWRAAWYWLWNRGTRELWDLAMNWLAGRQDQTLSLAQFWASAARASERRCFDYTVHVGKVLKPTTGPALLAPGDTLGGFKRLTYGPCSNPWRQLTELQLTTVPGTLKPGVLELDGRFLTKQGYPLLRVTRQENQIVALAELASWAACWARMLVSIHLWSFRAPDVAPMPPRELLPAAKSRHLPEPAISEIELDAPRRGIPVRLRLTRYDGGGSPIALIHGYSASGTTFTHDAIPMPLALYLWRKGYDVWVLDLRTSAGMPSAVLPWHFEDAALADIPVAIAEIRKTRNDGVPVDVVAHCIGAVMLGTALLANPSDLSQFDAVDVADGGPRPRRYVDPLRALGSSIGKIVLSQKAPTLVYSDANVLRAYFMRVMRRAILPDDYQFAVPTEQGLGVGVLDRLLSTMPYPDSEFRRENPILPWRRTPWAGFRHRMDALYARDFSLGNISGKTLRAIHDLFGPLNLDTVSQAIHFARHNTITDGAGRAIDTQGATLAARWPRAGTLAVHGSDNGLADVATLDLFDSHMQRAGLQLERLEVQGYGHQDCLIGRHADRDVFKPICDFLERRHETQRDTSLATPVERLDPQGR
jgi:cholesterol oxidase